MAVKKINTAKQLTKSNKNTTIKLKNNKMAHYNSEKKMQYMCCTVDMTYIRCAKFPVSVLAALKLNHC